MGNLSFFWVLAGFAIVGGVILGGNFVLWQEVRDLGLRCGENVTLRSGMVNARTGNFITGLSYDDEYYLVVTSGRSAEEIADTETHELCHQLVARNPEHFCNETYHKKVKEK